MIGRGLFLLTVLSNCVLSLPVTPSQLENEDVEVMKCIVEVLADVLSRPHVTPVSQECLVTLKTDDRLVKILRHHKFLKELQEIAVQGDHERAELQRDSRTPASTAQPLPTTGADRSMLEALGGPGERSILSQQKRTGNGDGREGDGEEDGESREDGRAEGGEEVERRNEGEQGSRASESEWRRGGGEDEEEESLERRANSDEESEEKRENSEESEEGTRQGDESDEKRDAHRHTKDKMSEEEGKDKRHAVHAHQHGEEVKRWSKRAKYQALRKKSAGTEARRLGSQQEVPHHSKEDVAEEEEEQKRDPQRSPEERELQMIAHGAPEERRVLEEEGSAGRKSEEPEIESLAAIESELENVAQKLHELRRG